MKNTDELETPPWLFKQLDRVFHFDIDACASPANYLCPHFYTKEISFLDADIAEGLTVWMNPPYSNPGPFLDRSFVLSSMGVTTVALIKGDPSTRWWQYTVENKATLKWIPKRIRFYLNGEPTKFPASFPSILAIYWGIKWKP